MSRFSVVVIAVLLMSSLAAAQEPSHVEAIEELFELTNVDQAAQQLQDVMRAQLNTTIPQQLGYSEDQRQAFMKGMDRAMTVIQEEMSWEKMKPDMIKIYADIYTEDDVRAVIEFYRTPVGQKSIAKRPEIIRLSSEVSQRHVLRIMPKIQALMREINAEAAQQGEL